MFSKRPNKNVSTLKTASRKSSREDQLTILGMRYQTLVLHKEDYTLDVRIVESLLQVQCVTQLMVKNSWIVRKSNCNGNCAGSRTQHDLVGHIHLLIVAPCLHIECISFALFLHDLISHWLIFVRTSRQRPYGLSEPFTSSINDATVWHDILAHYVSSSKKYTERNGRAREARA